jgi:hypothetical protein
MTEPSVTRNDKSALHKWIGPNRGTHWAIAGSVAVIMLGSYLIYSNSDGNQITTTTSGIARTPAPNAPAPLTSKNVN